MYNYPYSNDKKFLKALDMEPKKEQFIRITVLDFNTEKAIASIEGKSTAGSCNLSGTSNMRRTASCTLLTDLDDDHIKSLNGGRAYSNIMEVQNLISMNKKVRIETGFVNSLKNVSEYEQYAQYETIWFLIGTFVINSASANKGNGGINISLTLHDKCALLNGTMGGTFPADMILSEWEEYNFNNTKRETKPMLIKDIIKYIVVNFGGERPGNVFISDIPNTIRKVVKWNKSGSSLYLYQEEGEDEKPGSWQFSLAEPTGKYIDGTLKEYQYGDDIGYVNEEFIYPGELICKSGESVATVLNKIKNVLGNFEWYYDAYGHFIFQEVKNFINISTSQLILQNEKMNIPEREYLSVANYSKSVYTFDDSNRRLISSISCNPQFPNIKNDYVVWGTGIGSSGIKIPIRYHFVFDTKPTVSNDFRFCLLYTDFKGLQQVIPLQANKNFFIITEGQKEFDKEKYYIKAKEDKLCCYHWNEDSQLFEELQNYELCYLKTDDWRTELYFQGLEKVDEPFAQNYYAAELNAEWPKIYDVKQKREDSPSDLTVLDIEVPCYSGGYRTDKKREDYEFWLDFVSGQEGGNQNFSQFNVDNIGRRTKIVTDNSVNRLFPVEFPDFIIISADGDVTEEKEEAEKQGQKYVQVSPEVFDYIYTGGNNKAAFDKVKELLYTHTQYNESITLSTLPIYYLEPNARITIYDNDLGINGDYLIKTVSLPLALNGASSINATKCLEKTF